MAVPLTAIDPDIPKSIEMIVSKCMQKKPELRYLTVSALIEDLKKAVTDPDGDFVKIAPLVDDSATIHISDDDVRQIRTRKAVVVPTPDPEDDIDISDIEEDDGEDGSDIDPKLEKAVVIGSIAAGVILALIVIFIVIKIFLPGGSKEDDVTETAAPTTGVEMTASPGNNEEDKTSIQIDDLKDMDKNQAISYLNDLDMDLNIETEEIESSEIDEGRVISTEPQAGSTISEGDTVKVFVSSGKAKTEVPDVYGQTIDEAKKLLADKNFKTSTTYENSDTVEIEKVIRTIPEKNSEAEDGSTVVVVLSKGKATKYVKVPKLSNLTKKDAKKALEKVGLKLGNVTTNYSDTVEKNLVVSQSQAGGSEVETGTTVDITLSLGPQVTYIYMGNVTISDNPFQDEAQNGVIKIVLTQDGQTKVITEESMNYYSFPLYVEAQGWSESEGEIVMYVNGTRYNAYNISFSKVSQ